MKSTSMGTAKSFIINKKNKNISQGVLVSTQQIQKKWRLLKFMSQSLKMDMEVKNHLTEDTGFQMTKQTLGSFHTIATHPFQLLKEKEFKSRVVVSTLRVSGLSVNQILSLNKKSLLTSKKMSLPHDIPQVLHFDT